LKEVVINESDFKPVCILITTNLNRFLKVKIDGHLPLSKGGDIVGKLQLTYI